MRVRKLCDHRRRGRTVITLATFPTSAEALAWVLGWRGVANDHERIWIERRHHPAAELRS